ncbi:MAG: hypothetical protein OXQ29_16785 [Rhodospirillaceae bacterium]|nr:hypothetical protein [Rhodospirillaceae bacterium]
MRLSDPDCRRFHGCRAGIARPGGGFTLGDVVRRPVNRQLVGVVRLTRDCCSVTKRASGRAATNRGEAYGAARRWRCGSLDRVRGPDSSVDGRGGAGRSR